MIAYLEHEGVDPGAEPDLVAFDGRAVHPAADVVIHGPLDPGLLCSRAMNHGPHIRTAIVYATERFFQIDAAPIISAGSETFIDHLISRAGGINLAAGDTPYPRYSWEDILRMQPDIVIIASMAGGYSEDELKKSWRRWHQIPAVKNDKLFVVDAALFDRPTARLIDGLEILVDILHPSL